MKRVISNPPEETVNVSDVSVYKEYILKSTDYKTSGRYFWLRVEDEGCIFRQVDNMLFGHSGHSPSAAEAIVKVLRKHPNTSEVFEFNSFLEAAVWLLAQGEK
jgi:hypothetical protein